MARAEQQRAEQQQAEQQQQTGEPEPVPYPPASSPAVPRQRELPAQRTGDSARHGSFG